MPCAIHNRRKFALERTRRAYEAMEMEMGAGEAKRFDSNPRVCSKLRQFFAASANSFAILGRDVQELKAVVSVSEVTEF